MAYRLIQCMREGAAPDIDVYDAAAWSAPGPLSEASVAKGSAPRPVPGFHARTLAAGRLPPQLRDNRSECAPWPLPC